MWRVRRASNCFTNSVLNRAKHQASQRAQVCSTLRRNDRAETVNTTKIPPRLRYTLLLPPALVLIILLRVPRARTSALPVNRVHGCSTRRLTFHVTERGRWREEGRKWGVATEIYLAERLFQSQCTQSTATRVIYVCDRPCVLSRSAQAPSSCQFHARALTPPGSRTVRPSPLGARSSFSTRKAKTFPAVS